MLRLKLLNCLNIIMMQRCLLNEFRPQMIHQAIHGALMQLVLQPPFKWYRLHSFSFVHWLLSEVPLLQASSCICLWVGEGLGAAKSTMGTMGRSQMEEFASNGQCLSKISGVATVFGILFS